MKSFIRNLSGRAVFCLITLVCFWWGIIGGITAIVCHAWGVTLTAELSNNGALGLVIIELLGLAVTLWIGSIRGWSFKSFGLQLSWRYTAAGILLCLIVGLAIGIVGVLLPGIVNFLPVAGHLSLPFVILVSVINPFFEETMESGYFIQSLQRYGMWSAVLASALFRTFLHAYQGMNAVLIVLPIGLIFGFVYWKWRQLWPLIVAHILFDLDALFPRA
ncbi:MAG: amino terminal protease family protein [Phycisphaerales bacterium]|nr:amino terminal protease family protein [Phycisphaerales bacterium]